MPCSISHAEVRSNLVRSRDVVAFEGDFRAVVEDAELHNLAYSLDVDPLGRCLLADGLAALGLHMAARRRDEHIGWTISIQEPPLNLFLTADVGAGTLVGRVFAAGVEPRGENLFLAQVKQGAGEPVLSTVPVEGLDIFAMVERFYAKSEQRLARFFHQNHRVLLVQSLPDTDLEWLARIDAAEAFGLLADARTKGLETRRVRWHCGCDKRKIVEVLIGLYGDAVDELFGREAESEVHCPRCGSSFVVERGEYEAAGRSGVGRG
jgi:molecular chaperone Hsp33